MSLLYNEGQWFKAIYKNTKSKNIIYNILISLSVCTHTSSDLLDGIEWNFFAVYLLG